MIDYVKLLIKNKLLKEYLLTNIDCLFDSYVKSTSENNKGTVTTFFATYRGLNFKITESGAIIIEGSLHKYMNQGEHNYNDFSYTCLLRVIFDLCQRFKINPQATGLHNLEIGVNLTTPFNPTDFTDRCLFLFSDAGVIKPSPITKRDCKGFNKGIRFELTEYCLKVYNKGKQYNQPQNLLRVEYKTYKTRIIEKANINSLRDLCDLTKLRLLVNQYLKPLYKKLFVDEIINTQSLNKIQQRHYNNRLDYLGNWKNVSGIQRQRNKKYVQKIFDRYAETDLKIIVDDLLRVKADILLQETPESITILESIENINCIRFHPIHNMWDHIQLQAA